MKMTAATLTALLACLPSDLLAQCPPTEELNPCELALFETATILDDRSKVCEVRLEACQKKLMIRTSTVIREIVKPCPPLPVSSSTDWTTIALSGAIGLVLGLLAGLAR